MLKHNNVSICYEAFGNPKNPCVILIMGITGQLISWPLELVEALAAQGFYVIRFDNRDVGLSSYYDHLATPLISEAFAIKQQGGAFHPPYTLNDMADDILTLMDGLGIAKAHLVGISMGGMIAQIFALAHKDRILSLTCIATSSGGDENTKLPPPKPEVMSCFFGPAPKVIDFETYFNSVFPLFKIYNHPEDVDEEKIRKFYEAAYLRAYHPEGNQRQLLAIMFAEPRGKKLQKVKVPSLVIHGDCDPMVSIEHGQHLAQCLPNSHLVILERMGHGLPEKYYRKFVELLTAHFKNSHTKS